MENGKAEEFFRRLAENARDAIFRISLPEGRYEYGNPASYELFGRTREEFQRKPLLIRELISPEALPLFDQGWSQIVRGEVDPIIEYPIRRDSGQLRWISQRNVIVRDETGRPVALEGTCTDITERKIAEEELRKSEQWFRTIVETAPGLLFINDAEGNTIYVSPNCEQMTGYTREEFLGRQIWLAHPTDLPRAREAYRRSWELGESGHNFEYLAVRKDGEIRTFSSSWAMMRDDQGRITGRILQTIDITERRQLEEQLRHAQKMEAIGRLAGGIAHDFNNLLTTLLGAAQLILEDPNLGETTARLATQILNSARRGSALVRQLLDFSRKGDLQPQEISLNEQVRTLEGMALRLIGDHIAVEVDPEPGPANILADPVQIEQVLLNLALNARDAMPEGGRLSIGTRTVQLSEGDPILPPGTPPGLYVRLTVSDNGIGMDEATRSRIFEPFFTTKKAGQGTGLGLSTVFGVVKQAGGFIQVESEPGRGSSFEVYFPARPGARVSADAGAPRTSEMVLMVEDEPAVRRLTRRMIESLGFRVLEAADGREALQHLGGPEGANVRLVVTDIRMPTMSGTELAERLLRDRPDLPILFLSGYVDGTELPQRLRGAGTAFLAKPFTLEALGARVRQLLERS